jgi:very-short-patch-repair endonuclease
MMNANTNISVQMSEDLSMAYEKWMGRLRSTSKGERKRRLATTSNHAERLFLKQVWWPAFGHFNLLHAEYEVKDFKEGWRYLDFAYITEGYKICIEIDGFGTHWRDANRSQFSDHLMRQNHLVIDGWHVLRFSYDDIMEKPRVCQQIIQQLLGKLSMAALGIEAKLSPLERLIMGIATSLATPMTPKYATEQLGIHRDTVVRHIKSLVKKDLLIPTRIDVKRVSSYRVNKTMLPNYKF